MTRKSKTTESILYTRSLFAQAFKGTVAVLIVASYSIGVTGIGETLAYYTDVEHSSGNMFVAQSLDFSLDPDAFDGVQNFGSTTVARTEVVNEGTLDFQYTTHIDNIVCDATFEGDLTLTVERDGAELYSGALDGFEATTTEASGDWEFLLYLEPFSTTEHGAECSFDAIFEGWQQGMESFEAGGFNDEEIFPISLTANGVVLNEVLPNPEGDDTQQGIQGEWVELYNNSLSWIDVTDWYVKDAVDHTITVSASSTFNGRVLIGPRGTYLEWIVLYMDNSILNNTGDEVSLYNSDDVLVDFYAYGNKATDVDSDSNHTFGGDNENPSGAETSGQEGKSDARKPDGYGAWVDPVPTPGITNQISDAQALVLYEAMLAQFAQEQVAVEEVIPEDDGVVLEDESATTTLSITDEGENGVSDEASTTTPEDMITSTTSPDTVKEGEALIVDEKTDVEEVSSGGGSNGDQSDEGDETPQAKEEDATLSIEGVSDESGAHDGDDEAQSIEGYREEEEVDSEGESEATEEMAGPPEEVVDSEEAESAPEEETVKTVQETVQETEPEPVTQPEPTPEPEPAVAPEPAPEPEPVVEPTPESE